MSRALTMLIGCAAALLLAGCGSSTDTTTVPESAASATAPNTTTTSGGGVKFGGKPKFASPSSSEAARGGTVQVAYRNITIQPDTLRIKAGTTVQWTNYDSVEHNVTSESGPQKFASGTFGEGKKYSVTFNTPGVVHYECTIHPASMNGTIEVVK